MADKTLLDISRRMYESEALQGADYTANFLKGMVDVVGPLMIESKIKTEAFIATIPADFNMSKVPPELRDQLKAYAIQSKAEYAEAAKLAGRLDSTNPRYQAAVDKMNEIRTGFQNNLADLVHLKKFRDDGVLNNSNRSKYNSEGDIILENRIVTGEAFSDMTIGSDGISIMKDGKVVNIKDVTGNQLIGTEASTGFSELSTNYKNNIKTEFAKFDEDKAIADVMLLTNTVGNKNMAAFAYDGMNLDATGQSNFIDNYIKKIIDPKTGLPIEKFEEDGVTITKAYKDKYNELKDPAKYDLLKGAQQEHLIGTLRDQHDARVEELRQSRLQTKADQYDPNEKFQVAPGVHYTAQQIKAYIEDIKTAPNGAKIPRNDQFGIFEKRDGIWWEINKREKDGKNVNIETKVSEDYVIDAQGYSRWGGGSTYQYQAKDEEGTEYRQNFNGTWEMKGDDGTWAPISYDPVASGALPNKPNVAQNPGTSPVQTFDPNVNAGEGDGGTTPPPPPPATKNWRNNMVYLDKQRVDRFNIQGSSGAGTANILKNGKPIKAKKGLITVTGVKAEGNDLVVTTNIGIKGDLGRFKQTATGVVFVEGENFADLEGENKRDFEAFRKAVEMDAAFAQKIFESVQGTTDFNPADYK